MKFLNTFKYRDSYFALPPEKQAALSAANAAFVEKYVKSGKCTEIYVFGNMKGAISIWEVASAEEGARLSIESPLFAFSDTEVIPLVEWDAANKARQQMLESAQKVAEG